MARRIKPARIDDVVDGARLRAQLTAAALDHIGDDASLRRRASELLHGALFRGRLTAKERLEAGENGFATARLLAKVANVVIEALYDFTTVHVFRSRNPTEGEKFAVIAVGGYGRGELAPSSDIDLLFLRDYKLTPWAESVTEYMLHRLYDLSLKVGFSSRTVDECIRLAREDHTIESALLEMRHVAGDKALTEKLRERFRKEVTEGRHAAFIAAKLKERDLRHARVGASRYMVEPNVKEGKGGLRDLHTLFWLARHVYGYQKGAEYIRKGVFSPEDGKRFRRALEFMYSVRCHLHFLTGRAEERLSFDLQPEIAARLGYVEREGQPRVERFMKHYFLMAKDVGALTRTLCAKLEADHAKGGPINLARMLSGGANRPRAARALAEPGFTLVGGRLSAESAATFDDPVNILRVFEIADANDLDLHPDLITLIDRRLRRIDSGLRSDPRAIAAFLNAATSKRNPAAVLRLMNETGVLGRFVPEFGRVVGQMQFNMYHHYTVDEHTLRAVQIISDIENGRCRDQHPLASEIMPKVQMRRALYLAMLFHDMGKGAGDQCIMGEMAARAACQRLKLPEEEIELVAWLVRHHLLMSDTAQKRDIGDPHTIAQFAQTMGTLERLRLLLVLTVADIRAVGPGIWNDWKGQVLRDLFGFAEAALQGGHTDEAGVRERLAARAAGVRGQLNDAIGASAAARLAPRLDAMGDAYWLAFDLEALTWHAQETDAALQQGKAIHVAARPRPGRGVTEILVIAPDRKGLFASLAAAFANSGADIIDARINTTDDARAFDVFSVHAADGKPYGVDDPYTLNRLILRLEQAADGDVRASAGSTPSQRLAAFAIEPWVRIDNAFTPGATVIEASGRDRAGLLAELAAVFAEAGVSIASAHIGALGERVEDVFYVQAPGGGKITDPMLLQRLKDGLLETLRAGAPEAPSDPARRALAVALASDAR
ncbi:MAG: [protein-PII] uridylyltransferase [Hydrogenophilaceae bacterium]|jgi:[protein-PII] uridylyltransferase|nr:[protein-PII] uridylyltransferase [Hydrogenophilaceae bacterium]